LRKAKKKKHLAYQKENRLEYSTNAFQKDITATLKKKGLFAARIAELI